MAGASEPGGWSRAWLVVPQCFQRASLLEGPFNNGAKLSIPCCFVLTSRSTVPCQRKTSVLNTADGAQTLHLDVEHHGV